MRHNHEQDSNSPDGQSSFAMHVSFLAFADDMIAIFLEVDSAPGELFVIPHSPSGSTNVAFRRFVRSMEYNSVNADALCFLKRQPGKPQRIQADSDFTELDRPVARCHINLPA
jgi:hypothetical protein